MLLNRPFISIRIGTINFKAFMRREHQKTAVTARNGAPVHSFIPLHPAAMIDPVFIGIAAGVLFVALIEKSLADSDNVTIAAFLSAFLRISFPVVCLAAIWFLVNSLKFLLR